MFVKTPGHQVQNSLQGSFAILGILNPKPTESSKLHSDLGILLILGEMDKIAITKELLPASDS